MSRSKKIKEEPLVTDQPGRKVIFAGLIISFVFGFFIRGLTKPEFLQTELKRAVSKIHSSTEVNWGASEISLKNGLLPRFSILIHDVKIVSAESCWGQPLLYARELELPISFLNFFEKGQPLKKIYVRDAFLELKSGFACEKKKEVAKEVAPPESAPAVRLKPKKESPEPPPLVLTDFVFENLKVRQKDWVFPDWNFRVFELNVKENQPWYAEVSSEFNIPDLDGVETGAELSAVYKEFPTQVLEVKVVGHWREGAFQVSGNWEGPQKGWSYQSTFNHIPFQFLRTIAKRTKTPWNWPDKPMWFSFATQTIVPFTDWKESQHFVRGMKIEGDLGELSIPDIEIKSWNPFKVQPFAFSVNQADLSTVFEKELKKFQFLSSLGKLSGQGQWSSEKDLLFTGKVETVQIPIFHKDQKITQIINSIDLQAELKNGQWKMNSQKWDLAGGNATGSFKLESSQNISTGSVQLALDTLRFSPDVLRFMEVVTPEMELQGRLNARWKNAEVMDLSGFMRTEQLETRTFRFDKPVMNLRKNPTTWDLRVSSQQFAIRELSFGVLNPQVNAQLQFPYESKVMNANFQWDLSNNMKWNLASSTIRSTGTIEADGGLKGSVVLGNKNQEKTLQLSGSRRSPQILLLR